MRELLGLDDFFNGLARELSLGQRMRADLALALLHEPEILLLDEPTLGLDVLARRRILAFIRDLNRERAVTVVVTSHDMAELEQLAGRIVMLHAGRDCLRRRLRRPAPAPSRGPRLLTLETTLRGPPGLAGRELLRSDAGRHEYELRRAATVKLSALLEQAAAQAEVLDVETHRAPIDDVVADLYEHWLAAARRRSMSLVPCQKLVPS